jgi:hypothetical protein
MQGQFPPTQPVPSCIAHSPCELSYIVHAKRSQPRGLGFGLPRTAAVLKLLFFLLLGHARWSKTVLCFDAGVFPAQVTYEALPGTLAAAIRSTYDSTIRNMSLFAWIPLPPAG